MIVHGQVHIAEITRERMHVQQRYSFQCHDGNIIVGTLRSYFREISVLNSRLVIEYYTVNNVFCHGYYSLPSSYIQRIWKVMVDFAFLPEEINNMIQEYY